MRTSAVMSRCFAAAAAVVALAAPNAAASTVQSEQMRATFLGAAAAPTVAAEICMVDTGVNQTANLQEVLVGRSALDGSAGEDTAAHGTMVAHAMAGRAVGDAPAGLFTHARVFSVRVTTTGSATTMADIAEGIDRCASRRPLVIEVALAGVVAGEDSQRALTAAVARARAADVLVVAGAGNERGGPVGYPARIDGVLTVGAADANGAYCAISSRGPEVDLLAPGCGLELADASGAAGGGQGTSFSSALVAASAAALRSYTGASSAAAEQLLLSTARRGPAGPAIAVDEAFRAAGRGDLVVAPSRDDESFSDSSDSTTRSKTTTSTSQRVKVVAPRKAKAHRVRKRLVVSVRGRARGLRLVVRARGATFGPAAKSKVTLRRLARTRTIKVAFAARTADGWALSRWVKVRVRTSR